jgi:two-component system response regulator ResD
VCVFWFVRQRAGEEHSGVAASDARKLGHDERDGYVPAPYSPMKRARQVVMDARRRVSVAPTVSAPASSHVRGNVLVVEDEPTIADLVSRYLRRAGYQTRVALDGRQAMAAFEEDRPDLMVLDIMLPRIDGLEVMRRVRQRERDRVAIIMLTAKGEELDRITGLRLGADDYITKPFSPGELVARVDAVLRRLSPEPQLEPLLRFDGLTVDPSARRVRRDGEELELTPLEFDLLLYLARHPGRAFSREKLMDAVWQYSFYSDTSTVTVHIRRLRSKLEADPTHPRWLETVWGVGYRFQP